jgi:hypothetical protein
MDAGLIVSILAYLFGSLFAGYLALSEFQKPNPNWVRFFILLVFFLGLLGFGVVDKLMNWQSSKDSTTAIVTNDSVNSAKTQKLVDSSAYQMDTGFKKTDSAIGKIPDQVAKHLITQQLPPFLDVISLLKDDPDPVVERVPSEGLYRAIFTVTDIREAEAYVSLEKTANVVYIDKKPVVIGHIISKPSDPLIYFSKNFLARPRRFMSYFKCGCDSLPTPTDTLYFCFKLEYTDKDGNVQRPLERIYSFHCGEMGVPLQEDRQKIDQLKNLLLKKKYW